MLDEAFSVVSFWTSLNSWLTPAVLFLLLNLVIGTIAITSGLSSPSSKTQSPPSNNPHAPQPLPQTTSSVLHRLRSLHLYRSDASPPSTDSVFQNSPAQLPDPDPIFLKPENALGQSVTPIEEEQDQDQDQEEEVDGLEGPTMEQVFSRIQRSTGVFGRSKSDGGHAPAPKKVRKKKIIHKAASDISSVIGQFHSPIQAPTVEEEEGKVGGGEVDGQAEDFINRFRQQLDLQRLDSIYGATS